MAKDSSSGLVGRRIKEQREKIGITQAKLALDAEITPAAISQIEAGDRVPSSPILRKSAGALGVSSDFLLGTTKESELKDLLQDEQIQKFFRGFKDLTPGDKKTIEKQIEFLKSQKK